MIKLQKLLSFYSIIVVTALVIGAPFFQSRTEGLFILVLFAPVAIFFWLKVTNPEKVSTLTWSLRLVVVIGILTGLGICGYHLYRQKPPDVKCAPCKGLGSSESPSPVASESATLDENLIKPKDDLSQIKNDLKEIKAMLNAKGLALGITEDPVTSPSGNQVTIGLATVRSLDVFESKSVLSSVVGKMTGTNSYTFTRKESGWYLIDLTDNLKGWVQAEFVKEI
jgi:hypothetical protein